MNLISKTPTLLFMKRIRSWIVICLGLKCKSGDFAGMSVIKKSAFA